MKKDEMSAAEKKRIEALDKKIEKLKSKVDKKHQEFAALNDELLKLIYERHPERKTEYIKKTLYDAYCKSNKSLDEVLGFIQSPYPEEELLNRHYYD